jgi:hypothetical protein
VRSVLHLRRKERWPPPSPISPEGRIAGLTTAGSVIASAVAWLAVTIRIALCTKGCTIEPGLGGLVLMPVAVALVAALALLRSIIGRPTDPEARSGWWWAGLGVIFTVGVAAAASGIPSLTCPDGTNLSFFGFCAGDHGARLAATSRVGMRRLIDVAGVVLGFTLMRSKRWVRVTAPVAGLVFLAGTSLLLVRILVKG